MGPLGGGHLLSQGLIFVAVLSGVVVISLKAPVRALLAAAVQLIAIAGWLSLAGHWPLSAGVLVLWGLLYLRALQFFRAMGLAATQTRHRLRYSQVVGLLGGVLLGLFVALQLLQGDHLSFLPAWLIFGTGLTGVLARRNSFIFLLSLQMMFNAALFVWGQVELSDSLYGLGWELLFLVALGAYWLVGWAFFVNRLLAKRSLDLDAAHMLKS